VLAGVVGFRCILLAFTNTHGVYASYILICSLVQAFSVFDKDGNGFIAVSELRSIYMSFGEKFTEAEVDEAMAAFDDGSGMVNYTEVAQMMLS